MPLTFPKQVRVRSSRDFDLAFSSGRRDSSAAMLVVARENGLGWSRLGLSTGKRFGESHQRNRAKRLLRESFRLEQHDLPVGYDFIIVPRADGFPDHMELLRPLLAAALRRVIHGRPMQPRDRRKPRR